MLYLGYLSPFLSNLQNMIQVGYLSVYFFLMGLLRNTKKTKVFVLFLVLGKNPLLIVL